MNRNLNEIISTRIIDELKILDKYTTLYVGDNHPRYLHSLVDKVVEHVLHEIEHALPKEHVIELRGGHSVLINLQKEVAKVLEESRKEKQEQEQEEHFVVKCEDCGREKDFGHYVSPMGLISRADGSGFEYYGYCTSCTGLMKKLLEGIKNG